MSKLTLYGDPISGNCLKTKWTADYLNLDYEWIDVDILNGGTRTAEFLKINPFGQIPTAVLDDGRVLTQSNAIIVFLAGKGGRDLLPDDPFLRADVFKWLFWEQNSHEPYVAGRRFRKAFLKLADSEIDSEWLPRGNAALALMDETLTKNAFLTGNEFTLADVSLLAYTRLAKDGGFDLNDFPSVQQWIARTEKTLGISPLEAS